MRFLCTHVTLNVPSVHVLKCIVLTKYKMIITVTMKSKPRTIGTTMTHMGMSGGGSTKFCEITDTASWKGSRNHVKRIRKFE